MDKEKEIEELAEELEKGKEYPYITTPTEMAERLVIVGYGNVKQAVKEFAEKLKNYIKNKYAGCDLIRIWEIDSLITQIYGADDKE